MKKHRKIINVQTIGRTLIVLIATTVVIAIVGEMIRKFLDQNINWSDGYVYYSMSKFLSGNKVLIYIIGLTLSLSIFSNWIAVPNYDEVAKIMKQGIHIDGNEVDLILPKEMKALEEQIAQINKDIVLWKQAAKEAEAKKDELVVYLAHDIRTPLSSTLGYLSLLEESNDLSYEQSQKFIKTALNKTESIQKLVDELFEITRYNISKIELVKEKVNVVHMVQQIVGEAYHESSEKNIEITLNTTANSLVFVDPQKISRAFENIIVNAIRYTPQNEKIEVQISEDDSSLIISCMNYGTQIDQDKLDRVFERFYRGDESRETSNGSGLGLAIAKEIIKAHGGSISACNADHYVEFIITLPKNNN